MDIEIFAGAGGLTLGLERAGFQFSHVFELDQHACNTLKNNHVNCGGVLHGEMHQEDVAEVDWGSLSGSVRLLAGGVPCQPFSLGGRHLADRDGRNMFPVALRAVRALYPEAIVLENVNGLARPSFRPYLNYIIQQLHTPSVAPKKGEDSRDHSTRILQYQLRCSNFEYEVYWDSLEAADFGTPQNRKRIFIIAIRTDKGKNFEFPKETHRKEILIRILTNGEYWNHHKMKSQQGGINGVPVLEIEESEGTRAWRTVRDALSELPSPAKVEEESKNNHWLIPGAKIYRGHSGSNLDWPSKAIKAGVHGVPGGENIVLLDDGSHRYFTLRETAKIQGFPSDFVFHGARIHVTRQIGNAVPVELAEAVGQSLFNQLYRRKKPNV